MTLYRIIIFMSACLMFAGGCASGPSITQVTEKDNGGIINLRTGDSVTIDLPCNPTTGYLWILKGSYDENVVIMTGDQIEKLSEKLSGAPSKKIVTFKAVGKGTCGIKYEYRRPWENNTEPEKTYEVLLNVNEVK